MHSLPFQPLLVRAPRSLNPTALWRQHRVSNATPQGCALSTTALSAAAEHTSVAAKFNDHFASVYSTNDRWTTLSSKLEQPTRHVAYLNIYSAAESHGGAHTRAQLLGCLQAQLGDSAPDVKELRLLPLELPLVPLPDLPAGIDGTRIANMLGPKGASGGKTSALKLAYLMDLASVLPPLALAPLPGERVLDMCAAPGGKSLLLAAQMFAGQESDSPSLLVCNDRSPARRNRLRRVLQEYLPAALLASQQVRITGHDGTRWFQHEANAYDAILLDAPCSSERHLLQKQVETGKALSKDDWSPTRSGRNATVQVALLMSALRCVKPGGRVVYSTCSISPLENDGVVGRVVAKWKGSVQACKSMDTSKFRSAVHGLEEKDFGWMAMPDLTGWGPMYWSILHKTHNGGHGQAS